ncbi:extracellular solute-binding protein [Rubrimonas cliftonensis]|uniref:extracellular solute-binding protein n=1 Tax=Rubrimonas cliftonensis TaxID=89524 RepID=UPI001FDF62BC|nr:extracellular solute-binding protein [Rubrimonas cliftonensis]
MQCKLYLPALALGAGLIFAIAGAGAATAEGGDQTYGLAMHGAPDLDRGAAALPYARADAPAGGTATFGATGGFDSLNPFSVRGRTPPEVRAHTIDSLMARSWDEPFTLYPLIAERVETAPDRSWARFTLNPAARFSDGAPVTVDDVLWTLRTLGEGGPPGFRNLWSKISEAREDGPGALRVTFSAPDREAALILGLLPVLKRTEGLDIAAPSLTPLVASGRYVVADAEPGRSLTLRRDPGYWARNLPARRGTGNLDQIRVEWFRDGQAHFEAFRAGAIDIFREGDPQRWAEGYGFERMTRGAARKAEIPHGRPSGMYGLVFNTRRAPFDDIRVRRALTLAFNFEWINATLHGGAYRRITAYFDNSPLRHEGAAEGREREILAPFAAELPEGALEDAWAPPPAAADDARNRRNLRAASRLLEEAGWTVRDGALRDAAGRAFAFGILLGASEEERIVGPFIDALATLGVSATARTVDAAQYQARRNDYDFDMVVNRWGLSLSPGAEQRLYWGRDGVKTPGTRNYAGVDSPAVEAAIDALLAAEGEDDFRAAAHALDRALSWGVYVIPFWFDPVSRIAVDAGLRWPGRLPLYGDFIGWAPDVWWREPAAADAP